MSLESFGPAPPKRRFRRRVFFYLLTLSLVTSAASGATFYSRQVRYLQLDRVTRASTLLTNLATQAELGAYAKDAALCDLAVRRTSREPDVVFVGVYDTNVKEILRMGDSDVGNPAPPPASELATLLHDPDAQPKRIAGESYDDLWVPIVTSARSAAMAALSEPSETASHREVVGLARVGLSLKPAKERLSEVLSTGIYLSVGLMLLGALAALLIAGKISDPILALARGADEIRAGNLDVQIAVSSNDELGLLAESFNRMTVELRDSMTKLASLNRNLETEVERRTNEIRRGAEFNEILNAPIENAAPVTPGAPKPAQAIAELDKLMAEALGALQAATDVRSVAVLLTKEEAPPFGLRVGAIRGESTEIGAMPTQEQLKRGQPIIEEGRALVPVLFRGEPVGAIVLLDRTVQALSVDVATRAAGPLAIAISNVRAYAKLSQLARELTERNAALVKQRDQLSEMNRLKSEFLANTSHELRTPLNAILGYTELIHEGIYGPTTIEQREGLEGIRESATNLLTLINQILDLSKVESGKIELYVTEVAVHDLTQHVASESQVLAKNRPYKVTVDCPTRIVLKTDHLKVQQILTNLVANSIKFTERGSVQIIAAPTKDGGCDISVKDTGIGIRKEDQRRIFDEFRQADGSSTRKYGGTGLGLSIARRFAMLLGGRLDVESEPGKGSTFTLHMPKEPRAQSKPLPPPPTVRR